MCKHDDKENRSSSSPNSFAKNEQQMSPNNIGGRSSNSKGVRMVTPPPFATTTSSTATTTTTNPRRNRQLQRQSSNLQETSIHVTLGSMLSCLSVLFAMYFPFVLAPQAALDTYQWALWRYEDSISHFDNTTWTYATDYLLAIVMLILIRMVPCHKDSCFFLAGWFTRGLLALYMLSVTAGGLAHQFYKTTDDRNTWHFRLLWTICVGTVAAASGFMGAIATELVRIDHDRGLDVLLPDAIPFMKNRLLPTVPEWSWFAYAFCVTGTVVAGVFSCQRPACDIFIAGITQFPTTVYVMCLFLLALPKCHVKRYMRKVGCLAFVMNAPLLPMYPLLIQYTDWSLATVNTLLHTWLCVTWSLQGLSLRHVGNAIRRTELENDGHWLSPKKKQI